MNRRSFLKGTVGTAAGLSVLSSSTVFASDHPRVLVLGGRDFFGPSLVTFAPANTFDNQEQDWLIIAADNTELSMVAYMLRN